MEDIEITPEMIEAGVERLRIYYGEYQEPMENFNRAVQEIYLAMALIPLLSSRSQKT